MAITIPTEYVYCDCSFRYSGVAITEFTGLEAIEGKEVCVIADGQVLYPEDDGTLYTVANGKVVLPNLVNNVLVGIPYESIIETLPFDPGDSSMQGKQKKIVNLSWKFYETAGRFTMEAEGEEDLIKFESMFTGMKRSIVTDSPNLNGQIKLSISDPTPFTVLGYYPKISVYG